MSTRTLSCAFVVLLAPLSAAVASTPATDARTSVEKSRTEYLKRHKVEITRATTEANGSGVLVLLPTVAEEPPTVLIGSNTLEMILADHLRDLGPLDRYRRDAMFYPAASLGMSPEVVDLATLRIRVDQAQHAAARVESTEHRLAQMSASQSEIGVRSASSTEELRGEASALRSSLEQTRDQARSTQQSLQGLSESIASINATLTNMRQTLDTFGRRQTANGAATNDLQQAVKVTTTVVTDQHEALARLQQQVDALSTVLEKSLAVVNADNQAILGANDAITALANQVKVLSTDLRTEMMNIMKRIEAIK